MAMVARGSMATVRTQASPEIEMYQNPSRIIITTTTRAPAPPKTSIDPLKFNQHKDQTKV